jgi:hypothetical protein
MITESEQAYSCTWRCISLIRKGLFAPHRRAKHGQDLVCTISRTQKLERMPAAVVPTRFFVWAPLTLFISGFPECRKQLASSKTDDGGNMTFPSILGNRYLRAPAPATELPLARPVNLKQALHIFRDRRISWKPFSRRQNTLIQSDPSFQPLIFASRSLHSPQPSPGKKNILNFGPSECVITCLWSKWLRHHMPVCPGCAWSCRLPSFSINLGLKKTSVHPSVEKNLRLGSGWVGADAGCKTRILRRGLCNQVGLELLGC